MLTHPSVDAVWLQSARTGLAGLLLTLAASACAASPGPLEGAGPEIAPGPAAAPGAIAAPPPAGYDRAAGAAATRSHLEGLVALDTRNPPGNELLTAEYLAGVLQGRPGMAVTIVDVGDGRANLVARLRAAHPTARPVVVMGHMDVVGVVDENWHTPPLTVTEVDGYLHGRGVMDDKGMLAATATAMVWLSEHARDRLTRDIILLATAAEEGGPDIGVGRIVAQHRELLGDAEFALNEGGRIRVIDGAIATLNIQTTEKVAYNVEVTARGPSGHGSVPLPDNAPAALARAVARLHDWRAPARLNETTRIYFARLAEIEADPALAAAMRDLGSDDPAVFAAAVDVLDDEPTHNAVLRAGASLTMLDAGFRSNVIPGDASANFNLRVLPDDDVTALVAQMQAVAAEAQVQVALKGEPRHAPRPSPVDGALFAAMADAASVMAPGISVIPFMSTGATDGAALRAAGIPTYGVLPFPMEQADELRMHGDNERIPVAAVGWATEFILRTLLNVAG